MREKYYEILKLKKNKIILFKENMLTDKATIKS